MMGLQAELVIDVTGPQALLGDHAPVTILDVRPARDRAEWAIPGSVHVDAYEALKAGDPAPLTNLARISSPHRHENVALNEAGQLPVGDPTGLEAGGNRCAVS